MADHPVTEYLREWFRRVREFLREVPPEFRALVERESLDFQLAQEHAVRLRQLQTQVDEELWANIGDDLRASAPDARSALLGAYERAVVFCREEFGSLDGLPLQLLKAKVEKELARAETETVVPRAGRRLTVRHNFVERTAKRATPMFVRAEGGEEYGYVAVPLVLETDQPQALNVRLKWEFTGEARSAWPRDWPGPDPGDEDVVSVPIYGWQRAADLTKWHHPLVARLPIRTPKVTNPRLEVAVTVLDVSTDKPLGSRRSLRWDAIALTPHTISVTWGDATEPSHVRDHPIGPQGRADAIRERFVAGSSVAVIAPRRFGKSTLVEYLIAEGARHELLIPPAIVCTRYASASGFDYERLWDEVSESLVDQLGARLRRETTSALPAAGAFDSVRAAARKKGYKAVVLLFDEAQLFFPGQNGVELGSALKTLLERHLARRSDKRQVPLLFGLIGLPSLRTRAGSDLMGLLNPVEETRMDESELRPLIAKTTSGLQTTRDARQRLAATAGNLLILRALLEKLAVRASGERRVWVNVDDVAAVEEALKQDLQNGRERTVASYVRDVLNGADRVDDWRPIPSLPAAAAWARTWTPSRPETELKTRALAMLNQWCRLSQEDEEHGVRLVYTPDVLERHLQQLRERRVLDGSEFVSALLRAWLSSTVSRVGSDAAFREALFTGAQRRISLPEGASPVGQGAQATIWRYEQYAYRIKELSGEQELQRFVESTVMLEALRQIVRSREAGSDHIFDLVDMGLSAQHDREAVQIYRWIPGAALTGREGAFAADIVIELGVMLARGIRLLHKNNILHRDIHPRNIVLDDASDPRALRPVLIDFGFARIEGGSMQTAIAGDHVAPEVQGAKPEWTRAADVYALGSTLLSLVAGEEEAADLRGVLAEAMARTPEERPTAEVLLERLETLEVEHRVDERRNDAWREMWRLVGNHRHVLWFSAQMNKMQESLVAVALGFYRTPVQRYGVVADFLNQLTESNPRLHNSLWGLGVRTDSRELRTLGALRNQHVHGHGNQSEDQRVLVQRFLALPEPEMRTEVEQGAEATGRLAQLKALPELVKRLVRSGGPVAQRRQAGSRRKAR
ncbi:MAG: protein kinase family protein [Acidobacteria bacterium]|nr:protein kinase family protein [Acidobacteriota bacterium]